MTKCVARESKRKDSILAASSILLDLKPQASSPLHRSCISRHTELGLVLSQLSALLWLLSVCVHVSIEKSPYAYVVSFMFLHIYVCLRIHRRFSSTESECMCVYVCDCVQVWLMVSVRKAFISRAFDAHSFFQSFVKHRGGIVL